MEELNLRDFSLSSEQDGAMGAEEEEKEQEKRRKEQKTGKVRRNGGIVEKEKR